MVVVSTGDLHFVVKVPASTANLGPGFDTLGLAVDLNLTVTLEVTSSASNGEPIVSVECKGRDSKSIPADRSNYIVSLVEKYATGKGMTAFKQGHRYKFSIDNEIPIGKGLGSSGAATVAGITIGMVICGERIEKMDIYRNSLLFEKHPDNISASVFGGLNVCPPNGLKPIQIPWPSALITFVVVPGFELKTETSRSALPSSYTIADTVFANTFYN